MKNLNDSKNLEEQLMLLKMMTQKTGAIHEAQALQLKIWPMLIEGVESSSAKVDSENKKVVFELKGNLKSKKEHNALFKAIQNWTRLLLWDNTVVVFKHKNKQIYNSEDLHV